MNKFEIKAEYYRYEQLALALLGRRVRVRPVPNNEDALGYTAKDEGIFIAYNHPVMDGLNDDERRLFRRGVFVHELMHQVFTNFDVYDMKIRSYDPNIRPIVADLCNILEDPAIEFWAKTVVGGIWLKALEFSIAHIYKISPGIDSSESALAQFMNALINFGDLGVIKGKFTFPEARTCFLKASPIFYEAIKEPSCAKRMVYAGKILEISRPLWENQAELNKLLEELAKSMAEHNKNPMSGKGSGRNGDPSALSSSDSDAAKEKRRKITVKKISKEEAEAMEKEGMASSGELPEEGDITVYVCDELDEKNSESGLPLESSEKSEKADKDSPNKSKSEAADGDKNESKGSSEESDDSNSSASQDKNEGESKDNKSSTKGKDNPFRAEKTDAPFIPPTEDEFDESDSEDYEIRQEEYTLSESDIAMIQAEAEREVEEYKKIESDISIDTSPLDNTPVTSRVLGRKSCLNYRITYDESEAPSLEAAYSNVIRRYHVPIHTATMQLKKLFENDQEEREYRTSGRVNPARANSGKVTSRVFDKRKLPADKSNLSVMILVDESGSMCGCGKSTAARESCIGLAEIFGQLKIPTYIMGFTADTQSHDVVHNHYLTWRNTHQDRLKLLNITARANNLDGYSIRYAKEIVKKNDAVHKLVIVLSDGMPHAGGYSGTPAAADTKEAIKEVKKVASVLGVAIGNSDTDSIRNMYETDFMHISEANELFTGLVKKVKNLVRSW